MTYNPNFLVRDYDGAASYSLSFAAGNNSNRYVSEVLYLSCSAFSKARFDKVVGTNR